MKKNNIIKITSLGIVLVATLTIPVILYFAMADTADNTETEKVNLNKQSLTYLAKVQHMKTITKQEANEIKSDIQSRIETQLGNLNLQETIDYNINDLDTIKADVNLDGVHITITSVPNSTKATGAFTLEMDVTENINDRSIPIIQILASETNGLPDLRAKIVENQIKLNVDNVLNEGQFNLLNRDYEIINLDKIKAEAKYEEYSTVISVRGISQNLEGSFKIIFEIEEEIIKF